MVFHLHFLFTKSKFFFLLAGQRIEIYTNHFKINFCTSLNKKNLYQFDVDVEQLMFDPTCDSCEKDERLQVMKRIITGANLPLVWYDEGKTLYSFENLLLTLRKKKYQCPKSKITATGSRRKDAETPSDPTGNDRKSPKVEAVFRLEIFWIFSGEFLSISCAFRQEPVGISSEKIPKFSGWNTASMKSPE